MRKGFWYAAAAVGVLAGVAAAVYAVVRKEGCDCDECRDYDYDYGDDDLLGNVDPSEYCRSATIDEDMDSAVADATVNNSEVEEAIGFGEAETADAAPEHATVNDQEADIGIDFSEE